MSRVIIIVNNSHLVTKNELQAKAVKSVQKYDRRVLSSDEEFRHMESILNKEIQDLNATHPRCLPLKIQSRKLRKGCNMLVIDRVADLYVYTENVDAWGN